MNVKLAAVTIVFLFGFGSVAVPTHAEAGRHNRNVTLAASPTSDLVASERGSDGEDEDRLFEKEDRPSVQPPHAPGRDRGFELSGSNREMLAPVGFDPNRKISNHIFQSVLNF